MSVHGIQKGANCITPSRDQVIGGHKPEGHNGQNNASISYTNNGKERERPHQHINKTRNERKEEIHLFNY